MSIGLTEVHGCDADDEELTLWPEAADGRGEIFANWSGRQYLSATSALRAATGRRLVAMLAAENRGLVTRGSHRV
jgi:hypothetical protein